MTVREKINLIKKTKIYRLVFDNELKGLRLSMYNDETEELEYFDFIIQMIHDKNISMYLEEHLSTMPVLKLIDSGDGYLETENERAKKIKVKEFLDDEDVLSYTKRAISIIQEVEKCTN